MNTVANEIVLPPEFSGPAPLVLYTRYGDPRVPGWENKWITTWKPQLMHPWFPAEEVRIHKHFWPLLQDAFVQLEGLGLHREIISYHCGYHMAHIHESPVLSVHSWGAAIDMNADENPTGSIGRWSKEFLEVMTTNGIYCGQNWHNKDPMHFAMVDGQ